jgi:iron-sulfur cluster protein
MPENSTTIRPREVANKAPKDALLKAIRMSLEIESHAVRRNTQTFNRGRYSAIATLPDYNALKDEARAIKELAIAEQPRLIETLKRSVESRGGYFFLATEATDASRYIREVLQRHRVRLVVKGKSMTSEEVKLNHVLEESGIEVAETDLAEFILQVADEQPSHIVGPALHYSRERITALFKRTFKTDLPLDTGEELTKFARDILRQKFLSADAGITGANLIAADSGTLMLVESEANIRMSSTVPPLHIAIAGIEKIVPTREDFIPFLELLAPSATGQLLSSYTSIMRPPLPALPLAAIGNGVKGREFHLVILDNGRTRMREDPVLHEALNCIRCGACLNSCANFQTVGGHAYGGETYSGGIGAAWEAGTGKLENARFSELCTGCSRCVNNCPVRIDIPWLNTVLRSRLNQTSERSLQAAAFAKLVDTPHSERTAPLEKQFFANYHFFGAWGTRLAPFSNWMNRLSFVRALMEKTVGLDHRREVQAFPRRSWVQAHRSRGKQATARPSFATAVLVADVFTNYGSPSRGMAALKVLEAAGIDVVLSKSLPDGRAALSQGLITTATRQAAAMVEALKSYLADGRDIVVIEPSVLAMFRMDYRHLLEDPSLTRILRERSYEAIEYLWKVVRENKIDVARVFSADRSKQGKKLFYHSHCQQRTCDAAAPTEALLRAAGFDVITSRVECCGMAGSFGYKKEYYDLSMAVGDDLFGQIRKTPDHAERLLVASGISCLEQIRAGMARETVHPIELLAETLG